MSLPVLQPIIYEPRVMKNILFITCILVSVTLSAIGQNVSETNIALGISNTTSPDDEKYWDQNPPTYLVLNASKGWYNKDHWISLRKEAGLNLQYSNIHNSWGGLGASNEYTGKVISLFAEASLQARIRINSSLAIGLGPEAEFLLLGYNNIDLSYFSRLNYPNTSYDKSKNSGLNRDYFNKPAYGIKLSLYETMLYATTSIGLNISYLWTQSELSNFYATNYTRISFVIGFGKHKEELIPITLPKF